MIFRPELAAKVMAGEKTVTRRLVSDNPRSPWFTDTCGYRVGQRVAICPGRGKHAIGHAEVTSVERRHLGFLDGCEAWREGFRSAREFEAAWAEINGSCDPDVFVWRIGLRVRP